MEIFLSLLAGGMTSWMVTFYYFKKQQSIDELKMPLYDAVKILQEIKADYIDLSEIDLDDGDKYLQYLDADYDGVCYACPICKKTNGMFKLIPYQGEDGGREDHYFVGCLNCSYYQFLVDIPLNQTSEENAIKIDNVRKANALIRGDSLPFENKIFLLSETSIHNTSVNDAKIIFKDEIENLKNLGIYNWGKTIS